MREQHELGEAHLRSLAHGGGYSRGVWSRSLASLVERVDAQREERFALAADALIAVGVLTDAHVAPFRQRLAEDISRVRGSPPAAVASRLVRRAESLLGRHVAEVADRGGPGGEERRGQAAGKFRVLHDVCATCGVLEEPELREWTGRLVDASGGPRELEYERLRRACTLTELLLVVAGSATPTGALTVMSVEVYGDGMLVRWHFSRVELLTSTRFTGGYAGGTLPRSGEPLTAVSLSDDRGGQYAHVESGYVAHSPVSAAGTSTFATTGPLVASTVFVALGGDRVPVAMPAGGGAR